MSTADRGARQAAHRHSLDSHSRSLINPILPPDSSDLPEIHKSDGNPVVYDPILAREESIEHQYFDTADISIKTKD